MYLFLTNHRQDVLTSSRKIAPLASERAARALALGSLIDWFGLQLGAGGFVGARRAQRQER